MLTAFAFVGNGTAAQTPAPQTVWVTSWASAQMVPDLQNALPAADLTDATLRQLVHLTAGGNTLRLRLSNAFGRQPLRISSVHVARPVSLAGSATVPGSDRPVLFNGTPGAFIPAGAEVVSDPVSFSAEPLSSIAISAYFAEPPSVQTGHPGSRATSYYAHGDLAADTNFPTEAKQVDHWYQIAAVEVAATAAPAYTIVALGDSITDGHGATTNANDRWPDVLAARLQKMPGGSAIGVANAGIGGNRMLLDGLGPNVLARLDRDVLADAGTRWVILFEGVNDLGTATRDQEISPAAHDALVARVLGAYEQVILRAHEHGIQVAGGTITPYVGSGYYHPGPASEADRQKINAWIRTPGHFDAVFDFDAVVRDPAAPDRILPAYDSGDHLHPSPQGYAAMANSIALSTFGNGAGQRTQTTR